MSGAASVFRVAVAAIALLLAPIGCTGGQGVQEEDGRAGASGSRKDAVVACNPDLVDQSAKGLLDVTCEGPWQYRQWYAPCYQRTRVAPGPAERAQFDCTNFDRYWYLCRLPTNPLEPDQSVCQSDTAVRAPPVSIAYSAPGLTYRQVMASDSRADLLSRWTPKCSTADELPMSTPDELKAKFAQLEAIRADAAARQLSGYEVVSDGFEGTPWASVRIAGPSTASWTKSQYAPVCGGYSWVKPRSGSSLASYYDPVYLAPSVARMESPWMVSMPDSATLSFWVYYFHSSDFLHPRALPDVLQAQVSTDGVSWTSVGPEIHPVYSDLWGWRQTRIDLVGLCELVTVGMWC